MNYTAQILFLFIIIVALIATIAIVVYVFKKNETRAKKTNKIIEQIRLNLDINEIKHIAIENIIKELNADRCFLAEYVSSSKQLEYVKIEHLSEHNPPSLVGNLPPVEARRLTEWAIQNKEHEIYDITKYIKDFKLQNTLLGKFYKNYKVKSTYALPVSFSGQTFGILVLHFTQRKRRLNQHDKEFLRKITNNLATAIYQTSLYKDLEDNVKRETLIRDIVQTIKISLDMEQASKFIVKKLGKALNAQRCYIRTVDKDTNIIAAPKIEYRSSDSIKSLINEPVNQEGLRFFINEAQRLKMFTPMLVNERTISERNLKGTEVENYLKSCEIKTIIAIPMWDRENELSFLVLHYEDNIDALKEAQIELMETIAKQTTIALGQIKAYNKEQNTAKRESLLRKVTETIRTSLDMKEVLTKVGEEIGKTYNVQRVTLNKIVPTETSYDIEIVGQYKESESIKGVSDMKNRPQISKAHCETLIKLNSPMVIDDIENWDMPDFVVNEYKAIGIKSVMACPIKKEDHNWGFIFLSEYNQKRKWTQEEIKNLKSISDQVYLAINQAQLYKRLKERIKREKTLRKSIESSRELLNLEAIKQNFVQEAGSFFKNASRVFISEYDKENQYFLCPTQNSEYLAGPYLKSVKEEGPNFSKLKKMTKKLIEDRKIQLSYYKTYVKENDLEGTEEDTFLKKYNVKSCYVYNITYGSELLGAFVIHSAKENSFTEDDFRLVESLADQIGIAMHQAELFDKIKMTAKKESLLREITGQIKLSDNLEQIYNYLIQRIATEFNVSRVLFFETPTFQYKDPELKHEFILDKFTPLKNSHAPIPKFFIELIEKASQSLKPFLVKDTDLLMSDEDSENFYNLNNIKSFFIVPMIRYNAHVKILGVLIVCDSKKRKWTKFELELIESIINSSVSIVWEITKIIEINTLRDSFIETLAHDLQVPLIGEEKALEFLMNQPEDSEFYQTKEIVEELALNNKNIIKMLKKTLSSYYYEANRKVLNKELFSLPQLIASVKKSLEDKRAEKSIKLNIKVQKFLPKVYADKEEIKIVIETLIENALTYTPQGGNVFISAYKIGKEIIVCISDNGPGLDENTKNLIFKRYEMVKKLDRSIGSGMSLYLSKLIIDAHNGRIWYNTQPDIGSIFCFALKIPEETPKAP